MPETVIIRARPETRDQLRDLAKEEGTTAIDTLERLIREAAEARLLTAVVTDLSFASEATEPELAAWDDSLMDGLHPGEDFSSWR
jgi:predicted DNA-binding protein